MIRRHYNCIFPAGKSHGAYGTTMETASLAGSSPVAHPISQPQRGCVFQPGVGSASCANPGLRYASPLGLWDPGIYGEGDCIPFLRDSPGASPKGVANPFSISLRHHDGDRPSLRPSPAAPGFNVVTPPFHLVASGDALDASRSCFGASLCKQTDKICNGNDNRLTFVSEIQGGVVGRS